MGTGLRRRYRPQVLGGVLAEGAAGGRQQYTRDTGTGRIPYLVRRHALENGVVFGVDRQEFRPGLGHGIHKQLPGHNKGFFIGK